MSHPDLSSPAAAPVPTCGACGAPVAIADVTCPACGVLLAAYQAPAGAAGGGEAPAAFPPMDTGRAVETAPRHRPRSQSPIGDALRRSRQERDTGPDGLASPAIADELARMATSDSTLAREVEAELAGARVTFDGAGAVLETGHVEVTHTRAGDPVVVAHGPAAPATAGKAPGVAASPPPAVAPVARSQPALDPGLTPTVVTPATTPPAEGPATTGFDPATLVRWLPFILIGCVMLGIGRSLPGLGGFIGIALVIGLVYLLVKAAAASSRRTTSMPRDERWKAKPPRQRR